MPRIKVLQERNETTSVRFEGKWSDSSNKNKDHVSFDHASTHVGAQGPLHTIERSNGGSGPVFDALVRKCASAIADCIKTC
jgi:hypothetical protein